MLLLSSGMGAFALVVFAVWVSTGLAGAAALLALSNVIRPRRGKRIYRAACVLLGLSVATAILTIVALGGPGWLDTLAWVTTEAPWWPATILVAGGLLGAKVFAGEKTDRRR